jgi:hypothetical protein
MCMVAQLQDLSAAVIHLAAAAALHMPCVTHTCCCVLRCVRPGTNKRPVPLEHHIYYAGEIYPVMSGDSAFNADGIRRAAAAHRHKTNPEASKPAGAAGGGGRGGAAAARPTGRGQAQGPNRGGGGGGGGRGRGYGGRGGGADGFRRQLQGALLWRCTCCTWSLSGRVLCKIGQCVEGTPLQIGAGPNCGIGGCVVAGVWWRCRQPAAAAARSVLLDVASVASPHHNCNMSDLKPFQCRLLLIALTNLYAWEWQHRSCC